MVSRNWFHFNSSHKLYSTFNYYTLSIEFEIQNISILFRFDFSWNFRKWTRYFWPSVGVLLIYADNRFCFFALAAVSLFAKNVRKAFTIKQFSLQLRPVRMSALELIFCGCLVWLFVFKCFSINDISCELIVVGT